MFLVNVEVVARITPLDAMHQVLLCIDTRASLAWCSALRHTAVKNKGESVRL